MNQNYVDAIVAESRTIDAEHFLAWRGGWPNDIELALLDAVLSIRAQYETKSGKGVMPRVLAYRDLREGAADDLRTLSSCVEEDLIKVTGRQVTGGQTKARAVIEAAHNLVSAGVVHGTDFDPKIEAHRNAYISVKGLGKVTFAYLCMLLGHPDVKSDIWINRFVHRVTGDNTLKPDEVQMLVRKAASDLPDNVSATALDHAIWRSEARREASDDSKEIQP